MKTSGESVTYSHLKIVMSLKSARMYQRLVNSLIAQNYFNF